MIDASAEARCRGCEAMLVHAGAICVVCDDRSHYEAPIRTSPPLRMPEGDSDVTDALARFGRRLAC
jgi:hypothetical protein